MEEGNPQGLERGLMKPRKEAPFVLVDFHSILLGIIILFFLECLSLFFGYIYANCLLGLQMNPSVITLLLLGLPILMVFGGNLSVHPTLVGVWGGLAVGLRLLTGYLFNTGGALSVIITSALASGSFLLFFACWFSCQEVRKEKDHSTLSMGAGFALAISASVMSRALGNSVPILLTGYWQMFSVLLGLIAVVLLHYLFVHNTWRYRHFSADDADAVVYDDNGFVIRNPAVEVEDDCDDVANLADVDESCEDLPGTRNIGFWMASFYCVGWSFIFMVMLLTVSAPSTLTRWTNGPYKVISVMVVAMAAIFVCSLLIIPKRITTLNTPLFLLFNVVFFISMVYTALEPEAKVMVKNNSESSSILVPMLFCALISWPILLLDITLITRRLLQSPPKIMQFSIHFFCVGGVVATTSFSSIMTIVWPYVPYMTLFRNAYWVVILVVLLGACIPAICAHCAVRKSYPRMPVGPDARGQFSHIPGVPRVKGLAWSQTEHAGLHKTLLFVLMAMMVMGTVMVVHQSGPSKRGESLVDRRVTMVTYNIQQGYTMDGAMAYYEQLKILQRLDADIIGLQETDTARLSGCNMDNVRFLADSLGYYSYYGPKTVTGTYGVALLSRFPIVEEHTKFMKSVGEQTAIIDAVIALGEEASLNVLVTHLGDMTYPEDVLNQAGFAGELAASRGSGTLMVCDCNMLPFEGPYNATTSHIQDSWTKPWLEGEPSDEGYTIDWKNPIQRIDYVFSSPDLTVVDMEVVTSAHASDHMPIKAVFEIPMAMKLDYD